MKKSFLATALVSVLFLPILSAGYQKPNIIFIMADDLGYADLGCYGQEQILTPNIDQMCKEGKKFTRHYSGSTVCAPSRCSLLTGKHIGHCYIRGNKELRPNGQKPLAKEEVTIAELLKTQGYTTSCIGKWGLGWDGSEGHPNKQGLT
jgi:arylsulfatase A-like enzyme